MSEGIFESYDPFALKVNNVSALDKGLVKAFKAKDREKIEEISNNGLRLIADVFITINNLVFRLFLQVMALHLSVYNS